MDRRLELQAKLEEILGSRNVYYQPPASKHMEYPCIRYTRSSVDSDYADDINYRNMVRYELVVIDTDPDSQIYADILNAFNKCIYNRSYQEDYLNHDVLLLYY